MNPASSSDGRRNAARILIAGYYVTGSGYPNGRVTQERLERSTWPVVDLGFPVPPDVRLWKTARRSVVGLIRGAGAFVLRNVLSAMRVMKHARTSDRVYVRYPGMPFMLLMSLVPARWRPHCYLEAFISIWDAAFVDRADNTSARRFLGPWVRALEGRAMRAADMVIVDTDANARFVERCFGVDPLKVRAFPLGVDEAAWERSTPVAAPVFTVLFAGTFVPLHGIGVITAAMEQLGGGHGIRFLFVGDGQGAPTLQSFIDTHPDIDIEWRREWLSATELASCVREADVCLGVFGGQGKASRVLPYKLYMYLCLGKPIITQSDLSTPSAVPRPPAEYVPGGSAQAVAEAILRLKSSTGERTRLAHEARRFYECHLSNAKLDEAWMAVLGEQKATPGR